METFFHDLRQATRALLRVPRVSGLAVLLLGLALGAAASIATVVFALLLAPLPLPEADRIVLVLETSASGPTRYTSYVNFTDWAKGNRVFEHLAAASDRSYDVIRNGRAEQLTVEIVTRSFFDVMGLKPAIGRGFAPTDSSPVGLVSHRLWASDPTILGSAIRIGPLQPTVVGVLPPETVRVRGSVDVWIALESAPTLLPPEELVEPGYLSFSVIGRLCDGIEHDVAQAEMERLARRIAEDDPRRSSGVTLVPLREHLTEPGTRRATVLLAGAVGLMLFVAAANVSNLLLTRLTSRERELAIRRALGATRARIVRALLLEGLLLSIAAALLGLGVASATLKLLDVAQLPALVPFAPSMDAWIVGFQLAIAAVTAVFVSLGSVVQLVRLSRGNISFASASPASGRPPGEGLRGALVGCQIALSVVLLVGTALLLRTLVELVRVPMVEKPEGLLQVWVSLPQDRYPDLERQRVYRGECLARVAVLPGVEEVAAATSIPVPNGSTPRSIWLPDGRRFLNGDPEAFPWTPGRHAVSPGHFRILGIPVLEGRDFSDEDHVGAPRVVIVNEHLAGSLWPGKRPLGKRLKFRRDERWHEVVGLVGDVAYKSPRNPPRPQAYVPMSQQPSTGFWILVRTGGDAARLTRPVVDAVRAVDPLVPILDTYRAADAMAGVLLETRYATWLLAALGTIALVISAVGVFALMNYAVASRTFEIGVRRALGAKESDIWSLILRRASLIAAAGVAMGICGALTLTRFLEAFLFGVDPNDAATLVAVVLTVAGSCWIAVIGPAQRAATVDPSVALRHE